MRTFRTKMVLVLLIAVTSLASTHSQFIGPVTANRAQKSCAELRREAEQLFQMTYSQKIPAGYLTEMMPSWMELVLPANCVKSIKAQEKFNPSSAQDHGGPLGTLSDWTTSFTMSTKTRRRRSVEEEDVEVEVGMPRDKRSAEAAANSEAKDLQAVLDQALRDKRSANGAMDASNMVDAHDQALLDRAKRFLSGLSGFSGFGGASSMMGSSRGPQREVSEAAQMMSTLLLLSRIQKNNALRDYRQFKYGKGLAGERRFKDGMYGDPYPGRKRRASEALVAETAETGVNPAENLVDLGAAEADRLLSRQKRFLMMGGGSTEPGEMQPGPSMMDFAMGTATDPNTGKRMEFGGDAMKRMMRSSFMASVMPFTPQIPGKEPPDFVKNMAPVWFMSRMQQTADPQIQQYMKDPGDYPMVGRSMAPVQQRTRGGYFGDSFPGKRRKRSAEATAENSNAEEQLLERTKRQAESGTSNDVVTIGDVSIPVDFFKPRDKIDDPKYYNGYKYTDDKPKHYYYQAPAPQPVYTQPVYQQPRYQQPRVNYNQQYVRQQQHRQQQRLQQQQLRLQQWARALYQRQQQIQRVQAWQAAQQRRQTPAYQWGVPLQQTPVVPPTPVTAPAQPLPPAPVATIVSPQHVPPPPPAPQPFAPVHQAPVNPLPPQPFNPPPPQTPVNVPPPNPVPLNPAPYVFNPPPPAYNPPPPATFPMDPFIANPPPPKAPPAKRVKRESSDSSSSASSDVLTVGDVSIPVELLKREQADPVPPPPVRVQVPTVATTVYIPAVFPQGVQSHIPQLPTGLFSNAPHHRHKRANSEPSDKKGFFPSFFWPFSPQGVIIGGVPGRSAYVPPRYSSFSRKIGYNAGRGGMVFGDRLPWARAAAPGPRSLLTSPASRQPGSFAPPSQYGGSPLRQTPNRRYKRSNSEPSDKRSNNFFFPSFFPRQPYVAPRYSAFSQKAGYSAGRGGVVFGDRLPWARTSPRVSSPFSARAAGPLYTARGAGPLNTRTSPIITSPAAGPAPLNTMRTAPLITSPARRTAPLSNMITSPTIASPAAGPSPFNSIRASPAMTSPARGGSPFNSVRASPMFSPPFPTRPGAFAPPPTYGGAPAHQAPHRRYKRANKELSDRVNTDFFWPFSPPGVIIGGVPRFTAPGVIIGGVPRRGAYSAASQKIGYSAGRGMFYGDRLPWARSAPGPLSRFGVSPANAAPHRRYKRSNSEPSDKRANDWPVFFPSSFFPRAPYVAPRYSPRSQKVSYNSGRGGVIFGDRMPWARTGSSPRSSPLFRPPFPTRPGALAASPPRFGARPAASPQSPAVITSPAAKSSPWANRVAPPLPAAASPLNYFSQSPSYQPPGRARAHG